MCLVEFSYPHEEFTYKIGVNPVGLKIFGIFNGRLQHFQLIRRDGNKKATRLFVWHKGCCHECDVLSSDKSISLMASSISCSAMSPIKRSMSSPRPGYISQKYSLIRPIPLG